MIPGQIGSATGYFVRLKVRNIGKSMARDCEGKLVRIFDAGSRQERMDFDPANLHWTGHGTDNAISIHKTAYEYLDLAQVNTSAPDIVLNTNEIVPRGIRLTLPRGDYILDVVLFGKNTEPVEKFYLLHMNAGFAVAYDNVTLTEIAFTPAPPVDATPVAALAAGGTSQHRRRRRQGLRYLRLIACMIGDRPNWR